jgi:hypothetical protein
MIGSPQSTSMTAIPSRCTAAVAAPAMLLKAPRLSLKFGRKCQAQETERRFERL